MVTSGHGEGQKAGVREHRTFRGRRSLGAAPPRPRERILPLIIGSTSTRHLHEKFGRAERITSRHGPEAALPGSKQRHLRKLYAGSSVTVAHEHGGNVLQAPKAWGTCKLAFTNRNVQHPAPACCRSSLSELERSGGIFSVCDMSVPC